MEWYVAGDHGHADTVRSFGGKKAFGTEENMTPQQRYMGLYRTWSPSQQSSWGPLRFPEDTLSIYHGASSVMYIFLLFTGGYLLTCCSVGVC